MTDRQTVNEPVPAAAAAAMERARMAACGQLGPRCVALPHSTAYSGAHSDAGGWIPLGRITDRDGWRSWDAWWHTGTGEVRLDPRPV